MNQIISQHGWGLDHSVWYRIKNRFIKNNWLWQDSDRGYFSKSSIKAKWIKDKSNSSIKLLLTHSLGIHLVDENTLSQATHIVLVNSFNNFVPTNNEREITLVALKKMEKKINPIQIESLLREFIKKSFKPNQVDTNFQSIFKLESKNINIDLLLKDFQKLYLQNQSINLFSKYTAVLIIKSKNDLILKEYAFDEFIKTLNKSQINKPKLVNLHEEGHLISKIDIGEIIDNWVSFLKYE